MVPKYRESFNANFTEAKYQHFLEALEREVGTKIEFRVCETPLFLERALVDEMQEAALSLLTQAMRPAYLAESMRAVPERFKVPNDDAFPTFAAVDLALTHDAQGHVQPKLIELQGFPSLYCYQAILPKVYKNVYGLKPDFRYFLGGLDEEQYLWLLREAVLAGHDPENVILMDIRPLQQKTSPDFICAERMLGVRPVCVSEITKRGRQLYYRQDGKEIRIHRIYNRLIIDEFVKSNIEIQFDFRDDLEIEWAPHPNWFFRISKFTLPFLDHPTVPTAYFLDQLDQYPADLNDYVLKPLYSFAGSGVNVDPSPADLDAIPAAERGNYLLQKKIQYAPIVPTPNEPSKVEVRMMFIWTDKLYPAIMLARFSKGKMMGVDYNKNKDWVGSSCVLFE